MPKFNVTRRVPFSADKVFAVAADVANYRAFLPLVRRSSIRNAKQLPDGRESFDSELVIAYKKLGIQETMQSQVTLDKATNTVVSTSSDGPMKHLHAEWRIEALGPEASEIHFSVDYALKSRSLQFVLSGMFDLVVRKIMTAFENRVREIYGVKEAAS